MQNGNQEQPAFFCQLLTHRWLRYFQMLVKAGNCWTHHNEAAEVTSKTSGERAVSTLQKKQQRQQQVAATTSMLHQLRCSKVVDKPSGSNRSCCPTLLPNYLAAPTNPYSRGFSNSSSKAASGTTKPFKIVRTCLQQCLGVILRLHLLGLLCGCMPLATCIHDGVLSSLTAC